jgi:hypothetical protein
MHSDFPKKPAAITSGKIMTPGGSENNKVYKQIFKNNITIRYVPYIDSYFIRLDGGSYYFENNRIVYVDQKSHRKTKIDLEFPHSQLKRLFVHGEHLFIADAKTKKLLHFYQENIPISMPRHCIQILKPKCTGSRSPGQVFIINMVKYTKVSFQMES